MARHRKLRTTVSQCVSDLRDVAEADVCYTPASFADESVRTRRLEAWEQKVNTSHNPNSFWRVEREGPEDHPSYEIIRTRPLQQPTLTKRGRQLVGLEAY